MVIQGMPGYGPNMQPCRRDSVGVYRCPISGALVDRRLPLLECGGLQNGMSGTPGPHNKNPRHKIFAKGWIAQNNIYYRYLDGCAKIFQGLGPNKNIIF